MVSDGRHSLTIRHFDLTLLQNATNIPVEPKMTARHPRRLIRSAALHFQAG